MPTSPVAVVSPGSIRTVIGAIVKLDGTNSSDSLSAPLTYTWSFIQVPIGSQVEIDGFTDLETDSSRVSFAPDLTGPYQVQLVVNNGSLNSAPVVASIDVQVIMVPHNTGFIPGASWFWNYLSDFWARVAGREKIETFWSSAIQTVASDLLRLYQIDYNKSIKDIQDFFQRRWLHYPLELSLDRYKTSFILADDQADTDASSLLFDSSSGTYLSVQPEVTDSISIPLTKGDFSASPTMQAVFPGRLLSFMGRSYTNLRSSYLYAAATNNTNGAQVAGTDQFTGSGFTAGMVGYTLRVFSPAAVGRWTDYLIATWSGPGNITVTTLTYGAVTFSAASSLTFSVLPPSPTHSVFVATKVAIPGQFPSQFWRFSPTIVSDEFNFDTEGVSPGDVVEVEVYRTDNGLAATFKVQVVSVDGNRLGFVFNTDALTNGVAAGGLSNEAQIALAEGLRVSGLTVDSGGALYYASEALSVYTTVNSVSFRRSCFEALLNPQTEISVGPFSVRLRPVRIYRLSKVPVDDSLRSTPILQERIKQPQLATQDGVLYQLSEGKLFALDRSPLVFVENQDYVVADGNYPTGVCQVTGTVSTIGVPYADLLNRGVREGDTLVIEVGSSEETYTIAVFSGSGASEAVVVYPTPPTTATDAAYRVVRRIPGRFLRFVYNLFDISKSIPPRLWAEISYFDNGDAIEGNFGLLVGLTREQFELQSINIPYRVAVTGLMYALTRGPTVNDLELAAHILLGLPFTEYAGKIIDIDPSYRTALAGYNITGRIMVEDHDDKGVPNGITSTYFYPQGRQVWDGAQWIPANPTMSGLATNPNTDLPYAVGDLVPKYVPLALGAEVLDYLVDPSWALKFYRQGDYGALLSMYHSLELLINVEITNPDVVDLVAQFIKQVKPSYAKLLATLQKNTEDTVAVTDALELVRPYDFSENASFGLPTAVKFDYPAKATDDFISVEGQAYALYCCGLDLATVQAASTQSTSAIGGFTTAVSGHHFDSPFLQANDLLVIYGGSNAGKYVVGSISDDHTLAGLTRLDGVSYTFETKTGQDFAVYRPITAAIYRASLLATNASDVVDILGTFSAGVAVGDVVVLYDNATGVYSRKYTVVSVDYVAAEVTLDRVVAEATGTYSCIFARPGMMTTYLLERAATSFPFSANMTLGSQVITFDDAAGVEEISLASPGDEIVEQSTGISLTIIHWDPSTLECTVTPAAPANFASQPCQIRKPNRTVTPITTDLVDRIPGEGLQLYMVSSVADLETAATSADVRSASAEDFAALGIVPGDYLVILAGADSLVDVGYGAGIYPILSVVTVTITLCMPLTETHGVPGIAYGIQRRIES